jgi:hypothetical protein
MKAIYVKCLIRLFAAVLLVASIPSLYAQTGALAVQDSADLEDQLDYIHENTRVYNDYRAVREDVFQKLRRNVRDTINASRLEIEQLNSKLSEQDFQIETLNTDLARSNNEKEEAIRNRDSLSFLGIQMKKGIYNTIMWLIIVGLAAATLITITLFRRTHQVTAETKKELQSTQDEFENYRKTSREKYEKLVVSHHSEIMKLKNS